MAHVACADPECDFVAYHDFDAEALGDALGSAVIVAISDACAERDCDASTDRDPCPCDANPGATLYFALADAIAHG